MVKKKKIYKAGDGHTTKTENKQNTTEVKEDKYPEGTKKVFDEQIDQKTCKESKDIDENPINKEEESNEDKEPESKGKCCDCILF